MGYRSQVTLALRPKAAALFSTLRARGGELPSLLDDADKGNHNDGDESYSWDHIKWYDTFEEVEAIQDFIQWCEDEQIEVDGKQVNADEYYRFVRIGEEMDDNEVQGWGFDIHIERTATY